METNILSLSYGVIFLSVLGEYLGIPIPSSMVLIVAGALAFQSRLNLLAVFLLALVAASLGDAVWFGVGRKKGELFLKGYCKLSLGSRDCVRRTREMFSRFPGMSLMLGKFVPGLSTFVVPVAGFSGMAYARFFRADGGGIILWAASMIGIGFLCGDWMISLKPGLDGAKWWLLAIVTVILIGFYGFKVWRLSRFGRAEVGELH